MPFLNPESLKKTPLVVTRLGERLVFWRDRNGRPVCMCDRCAHRGASLAMGKVCEGNIQCPFHGLEFDSSDRCVKIRANGKNAPVPSQFKMTSYPVAEHQSVSYISSCQLAIYFQEILSSSGSFSENDPLIFKSSEDLIRWQRAIPISSA
ncbi:MAG: Rieske 2Fe-2S domain-containing protein [Spirochaetales bacterium]|nr:Rieske 2Fe-2S domain-containing protein [Spirochaetales bacterium]